MNNLLFSLCAIAPALAAMGSSYQSSQFDYVVVGGGTAGLVVANRLSEDPNVTVAIIEAGTWIAKSIGNLSEVPAYASELLDENLVNPAIGWEFTTTPQAGLNNTVIEYPRAKAVRIFYIFSLYFTMNDMAYSRSSVGAYQLWADTVGDQSYTWDGVLPYYLKSMNFTPPDASTRFPNASNPSYDASETTNTGPLDITYPAYAEPWSTWVAKGLEALGIAPTDALLDGTLNGSTWQLLTVDHTTGHRASSDQAFLVPVQNRSNLVIIDETLAERVIFSTDKVATGVEATTGNTTFSITATKEVIISAGVFQSPQLLMVSGVGPEALLQQYGIPVVADLPGVGQGMKDHIIMPLTYQIDLAYIDASDPAIVSEFDDQASGPLTNPGGDFVGLEKVPASLRANWSAETNATLDALPADWPELEYIMVPAAVTSGATAGVAYGTIFATLVAPQSVGNVSITSANMSVEPAINPNWLTAQTDLDILVAGFKRVRQMVASEAMAPVIVAEVLPGTSVQTDEEILEYFQLAATSNSHAHSTNHMGNSSNPNAVVGTTGKVYGVTNLRVIDASIFPFLLPGPGPQAHVYMLAEKLAAAIQQGQ
ncbi:alcohol oxidase [Cryphonectria parasitica EP155]|uniref:Alcohol oxidase n=1 Tax=Cryphonectria parasitica (strain ATCC 38755 / EP155) TaxID=660469 RepID=A0A9P5CTH6_CRYP1|nr:alcohol oxidase [Cryphonectria parasitica EP155]KAF3769431.1 alcohol oxidase [Cryphonectria parasitica EP155]